MEEVRAGRLLVATPMLGDPNFRRTVVLVVEDEPEEGTLGVVLNRPTKVPVGRVLEPWTDLVSNPSVVFRGGPVAPNSALGLASVPGQEEPVGWRALDPSALPSRVGLIDLDTPPQLVAGGIASFRVFAGYAGWGPGQLEAEIARGNFREDLYYRIKKSFHSKGPARTQTSGRTFPPVTGTTRGSPTTSLRTRSWTAR